MNTLRLMVLAALPLLFSCGPSLRSDLARTRYEIKQLEGKLVPIDAPIWITKADVDRTPGLTDDDIFATAIQDHTSSIPDFVYFHILKKLNQMDEKEIIALSKGNLPWEKCVKDPDLHRGKFWQVTGTIVHLGYEKLYGPKAPMKEIFTGACYVGKKQPVLFHVIGKPEVLRLDEDTVDMVAIFVKLISVGEGDERISAPLFLAKVVRRFM